MKKILLTGSLIMASIALAGAQGTLKFVNLSTSFLVSTNDFGVTGPTDKTTGDYFYALFYDASTPSSANLLTGGWTMSNLVGTNYYVEAGAIIGPGGTTGAGVALPGTTAGEPYYFTMVGYSASLASTMTVSQMLEAYYNTDDWENLGYFGISTYNGNTATLGGAGSPAGPPSAIFGSSLPISSGFVLNGVGATPEPTTIALAGMGGLALLGLRRKK